MKIVSKMIFLFAIIALPAFAQDLAFKVGDRVYDYGAVEYGTIKRVITHKYTWGDKREVNILEVYYEGQNFGQYIGVDFVAFSEGCTGSICVGKRYWYNRPDEGGGPLKVKIIGRFLDGTFVVQVRHVSSKEHLKIKTRIPSSALSYRWASLILK
jgi:hypothetical protein